MQHFTSFSNSIQDSKAVFPVSSSSDAFYSSFLTLPSLAVKNILLHPVLHAQNANCKRQVDLPSGQTMSNGSNFPELNDKILICFAVPTAPLKHCCYNTRLVTHSTYFQDKLSPTCLFLLFQLTKHLRWQ